MEKSSESDYLFDKSYQCPVCDSKFVSRTIKANRLKRIGMDQSLRAKYETIDPLKYDVVYCEVCGYAALTRFFADATTTQGKLIRNHFGDNPNTLEYNPIISYTDALQRYQQVLVNAVVKKAKEGEKAYICLKMAWLIRGMLEDSERNANLDIRVREKYQQKESELLRHAYDGFLKARATEEFPLCGMDESTVDYIIAYNAVKFGEYDIAKKMIESIIMDKASSKKLKEMATELKKECVL